MSHKSSVHRRTERGHPPPPALEDGLVLSGRKKVDGLKAREALASSLASSKGHRLPNSLSVKTSVAGPHVRREFSCGGTSLLLISPHLSLSLLHVPNCFVSPFALPAPPESDWFPWDSGGRVIMMAKVYRGHYRGRSTPYFGKAPILVRRHN
jgi:hypothetical protein